MELLILKTGALGDVVRTTSILPGLRARHPEMRVTWLTAAGAVDLVRHHPEIERVLGVRLSDPADLARVGEELAATRFDRVLSFDDEEPLCALATRLGGTGEDGRLSGAYLDPTGERRYTPDVGPWFDMGLLSVHGKEEADRRKFENTETHATLFARMLGIERGEPALPLPGDARAFGAAFAERHLAGRGRRIGLNTGSGGRWESKKLPVERTVELARRLAEALGPAVFVLLGGPEEAERNAALAAGLGAAGVAFVDAGTDNSLLEFTAILAELELLVTSDSLALHLGVTQRVPVLAFFAPTPEAEIELYGRGRTVRSLAADYASYRKDADTSTLTVERLLPPALELLGVPQGAGGG